MEDEAAVGHARVQGRKRALGLFICIHNEDDFTRLQNMPGKSGMATLDKVKWNELVKLKMLTRVCWGATGLLLLSACVNPFAPQLDDGGLTGDVITDQSTPAGVLTNFKLAYTFKDSLLYADVLDSAFVFQYFDPDQGPSGLFVSWTRETDLRTTGRLLRTFDIINLEWLNTPVSSDTSDSKADQTLSQRFNLDLASDDFSFTVSGFARFTFRYNHADARWRIVYWQDESVF